MFNLNARNIASTVLETIGLSNVEYGLSSRTYDKNNVNSMLVRFTSVDKSKVQYKEYISNGYKLTVMPVTNYGNLTNAVRKRVGIKVLVENIKRHDLDVNEFKSFVRTLGEPTNPCTRTSFKICRNRSTDSEYILRLFFELEYANTVKDFDEKILEKFPNAIIRTYANKSTNSTFRISGHIYPKDKQNGLKIIDEPTIIEQSTNEDFMIELDYDTKLETLQLLFSYAQKVNKKVTDIHNDLDISSECLNNLLDINHKEISVKSMQKLASLTDKKLSVKYI